MNGELLQPHEHDIEDVLIFVEYLLERIVPLAQDAISPY